MKQILCLIFGVLVAVNVYAADNITVTEGSGKVIASDEVAAVNYQLVKLVDSTDESTDRTGVAASPLQVSLANTGANATPVVVDLGSNNDVTVTGSVTADLGVNNDVTVTNATAANCKVEATIAAAQTLAAVTSITNAVTVNSHAVTNAGTFAVQVDGDALTALQLIDNAIDGNYFNTNMNIAGTDVSANAGVLTAQTQRITIATDDEVNNLLGTIDADTSNMATSLGNLDNSVDGNYLNVNMNLAGTDVTGGAGAVAAGTPRVTLASDDPAVVDLAAIEVLLGTIDADTSTIAGDTTSIDGKITACNTGAVVVASGSITADLGANNDVTVTNATAANCKVEATIVNASINGAGAPVIDSYTHLAINLAAGNDQVLVASAASKQIWVYGVTFTTNVAGTVSFQDEDNTAISGVMQIDAKGGMAVAPSGNFAMPIWKLGTDKDLEVDIGTSEVDGFLTYALVSV